MENAKAITRAFSKILTFCLDKRRYFWKTLKEKKQYFDLKVLGNIYYHDQIFRQNKNPIKAFDAKSQN